MHSLLLMIQFMTRYPVAGKIEFTAQHFIKGMKWMPLVGLLVGIPASLVVFFAEPLLGKPLASIFAIIMLIVVTGGLHLDGIGDTADGLFSYRSPQEMLRIMRDSTLGTNGVVTIILIILLQYLTVSAMPAKMAALALLAAPMMGRMAITWHAAVAPYARKEPGLGEFVNQTGIRQAAGATFFSMVILAALLAVWSPPWWNLILLFFLLHLVVIVMAILFARYLIRIIGGITGDTIGATIELCETVVLLLIFLFWKHIL